MNDRNDVEADIGRTTPITVRVPKAAEMLGIGRSKLYQFIQSGEIETIKAGRAALIPVESLHAFVARRREASLSQG